MPEESTIKKVLISRDGEHCNESPYWSLLMSMVRGGSEMSYDDRYQLFTPAFYKNPFILKYRLRMAPYHNVIGGLVSMMRSQVMFTTASFNTTSTNPFWQEEFLKERCFVDGKKVSFIELLSEACYYSLSQGRCFAVVELDPKTRKPYVNLLTRTALLDWAKAEGEMVFAKFLNIKSYKKRWDAQTTVRYEFTIYQKEEDGKYYGRVLALEKELKEGEECDYEIPDNDVSLEGFEVVEVSPLQEMYNLTVGGELIAPSPVIALDFSSPLWLADQLFDYQRSLFNQVTGVEWALLSTNFAQLTFTGVNDPEILRERFTQAGDGYYLPLPPDMDAKWLERGTAGIQLGIDYSDSLKDKMFDTIGIIAASNARTRGLIRQSAESKGMDRDNLEILLKTYGKKIKQFALSILNTASIAFGEEPDWNIAGFEDYDVDALLKDLEEYRQSEEIIKSKTFTVEGQKSLAVKASEAIGIPQSKWQDIVDEIDSGAAMLSDSQLAVIKDLMISGFIPARVGLQALKDAQALPPTFPVEQALIQLGINPLGQEEQLDLSNPDEQ